MNIENLREYCLSLPATTESFPFDEYVLVFKVMNKMFALASIENHPLQVNLKCDPDYAIELREKYSTITPGYHMNKKLWNTVEVSDEFTRDQLKGWIKDSYDLVVSSLPKYKQKELQDLK